MPRNLREWLIFLAALAILAVWLAPTAFGEVTIHPPRHQVVAGAPSLFRVTGLAADELPRVTIATQPADCRATLAPGPWGGQFLWFEPAADGAHVVVLAIGTDAKPTVIIATIQVGDPGPIPEPDPVPPVPIPPDPTPPVPVPPAPGPRQILIILESSEQTPGQAATLQAIRAYCESRQHQYQCRDPDSETPDGEPTPWLQPWLAAMKERGIEQPALIIDAPPFDSAEDFDAVKPLPATGTEAIETVKEAGG